MEVLMIEFLKKLKMCFFLLSMDCQWNERPTEFYL